jgi:hypothetical protein
LLRILHQAQQSVQVVFGGASDEGRHGNRLLGDEEQLPTVEVRERGTLSSDAPTLDPIV